MDAELAAGRPFLLWNAFTMAEWDVVAGHEGTKFLGRGSYVGLDGYAEGDVTCAIEGTAAPALGALFLRKRSTPDAAALRAAEVASLREAVRHAHDASQGDINSEDWFMRQGLAAYDRWVSAFGLKPRPTVPPLMGDHYCVSVYRTTHRAAAGYLREIAPRHAGAAPHLLAAADHFAAEADALAVAQPLICAASGASGSVEDGRAIADALRPARDAYAAAIVEIEAALPAL
jgi:hypothetical protein